MRGLVERGSLGQKTKGGIYRKEQAGLTVLDGSGPGYRALTGKLEPELQLIAGDVVLLLGTAAAVTAGEELLLRGR
jgi:hypothetical protein